MPNPLSKVKPGAGFVLASIGSYPCAQNPRLAVTALDAVASWANVDHNLLRLYITLAGGPATDMAAVYLNLGSDSAKKNAIAALARKKLSADEQKLFYAILKIMQLLTPPLFFGLRISAAL